ncbi:sugar phosphate isomerase/epimerase family protein [Granulicella sp. dw_53]|uniref:sugar phosphate isomerase/epimerase family protein n=1 Tax=Granulicella sp. dw_53 TaxID=2719792 RepID=UPI002103F639|nr:sugar phosphate isomerase/epimerase family protein [Granulicella sp. dw_53]
MSDRLDRRSFMQLAGTTFAAGAIGPALGQPALGSPADVASPIHLGKVAWVNDDQTADSVIKDVRELGLRTCQIGFEHLSTDIVAPLLAALKKYAVEATSISEHNPGRRIFDFYQGPLTIGVVPPDTRAVRIQALKIAADVASLAGIPAIHTHCGFIPEDPNDPLYPQAVEAVKEVASHCKQRGVVLLCETGQETPITLVRMIDDVNLGNVFVNLDLANLILYGKGNPVDAMDVFGDRVRGIHAKDGKFPTNPKHLGAETPIGEGKVDFPRVFEALKRINYKGSMMIEREVGNEAERRTDILRSKKFLERLILKTYG